MDDDLVVHLLCENARVDSGDARHVVRWIDSRMQRHVTYGSSGECVRHALFVFRYKKCAVEGTKHQMTFVGVLINRNPPLACGTRCGTKRGGQEY